MHAGNDYIAIAQGAPVGPPDVVMYIEDALSTLYEAGARNFLVPNLPPLDRVPALGAASLGQQATQAQVFSTESFLQNTCLSCLALSQTWACMCSARCLHSWLSH